MRATWTSGDVPGQQGRLAVVTGADTGLGLQTARVLAARGASVVLAVRDTEKGKRAAAAIAGAAPGADVMVSPLDLASLDSIRAAAGELRAQHPAIDLLINNAATGPAVHSGQYYGPGRFLGTRGYPTQAHSSRQSHDTASPPAAPSSPARRAATGRTSRARG